MLTSISYCIGILCEKLKGRKNHVYIKFIVSIVFFLRLQLCIITPFFKRIFLDIIPIYASIRFFFLSIYVKYVVGKLNDLKNFSWPTVKCFPQLLFPGESCEFWVYVWIHSPNLSHYIIHQYPPPLQISLVCTHATFLPCKRHRPFCRFVFL